MQIVIDNLLTNYESYENTKAKDYLVILPGWMRTSSAWQPIAEELNKKYSVIILDFPGFGKTTKPSDDFDTYKYASFVRTFLKKLEISKATFLGHSFGGQVATVLAANTPLVKKLILVDSAGIEKPTSGERIKINIAHTLSPLKKLLPKKLTYKISNLLGSPDYNRAGEMRKIFTQIISQDLTHLLPKIKAPTLILWGDKDKVLNPKLTKVYKKLIPNSRVRIIWEAGHSPHKDKPKEFLEILCQWLQ